jgi:hypothetical protein
VIFLIRRRGKMKEDKKNRMELRGKKDTGEYERERGKGD